MKRTASPKRQRVINYIFDVALSVSIGLWLDVPWWACLVLFHVLRNGAHLRRLCEKRANS